ncbi:ATP-binding protein [Shewanella sp. YLB-07]|uniref:ATP-binding protein n=1 Tax=Shewanella sp. YLB-07 TaxID=2601268 RepID=UPI00128DE5EE|nr:ATP-binding protein [Shewanella sp. YLB-07]MPY22645.1 two-component sensor histidine kinase [Shewanella sp. YLB-07]
MKKLIASLVLVVLTTIASLGWSISEFAALQNPDTNNPSVANRLTALKLMGSTLALSLDNDTTHIDLFIDNWNRHNSEQLSLITEAEFGLPAPLKAQFDTEAALLLESDEGISLHYRMPHKGQILNINTELMTPIDANWSLNKLYTMLFYVGVMLIMLLWVSPLIRRLVNLSKATQAFGMGELQQRITVSKTSYIGSIETEFNRMADRIQQLLDDNKLLSRAVSHDLKTPIARLRFGIEALEETQNEQLRVKYFQRLNRNLDTMEELVMTLLSYARLDQANIQPDWQSIELNAWLQEKLACLLDPSHPIDFVPCTKSLTVSTDPKYLSMQVNNLLSNAQRFGHSQIKLTVAIEEGLVWIHVDDDGQGIDAQEADQVIKPFVRGQQSRDNAGHGMGLAIVDRIGSWMGSKLRIGRAPELGGARMSLRFEPLSQATYTSPTK